jgi:AcrR family transcriptional regulator
MPRRVPEQRFHDLIETATRVFIAQGYRRTQMADVATAMGVAKGTVYLYVESKEALFDLVLHAAAVDQPLAMPAGLPVPTPPAGTSLRRVESILAAEGGGMPALVAALGRRRIGDVRAEIEIIVRELYATLSRRRVGIKLVDRCAHDHPELAAVWYGGGREAALALLMQYVAARSRYLRRFPDTAVAARIVLETVVFWAIHRHWDPSPQEMSEQAAEDTVVAFILAAVLKE